MDKKIDVSSTVLEKGIDMAKGFLDKLIMPAVEELGLLGKDGVAHWRFNRQVKTLNKAKLYCEKHNINPKTISLKVLCPLLEYSGLEEDDDMQDKWAVLLGNMVDSEQNVENHVFPYILSQISKTEYVVLDMAFKRWKNRVNDLTQELQEFREARPKLAEALRNKIKDIGTEIADKVDYTFYYQRAELTKKKKAFENQLDALNYQENILKHKISEPETLSDRNVKEFELSNLVRLGVLKEIREPYVRSQSIEIPNEPNESHLVLDLEIDVESKDRFVMTELGILFIQACTEKIA
ncbi:hypothetical protein ACTJKC_02805 [Pedobacter sp. 22226]|uniref:Abi-alpha family protein n=1 Tax=Pedobacter sp. 22226 TaxID=3453894 RepID=UPI003F82C714